MTNSTEEHKTVGVFGEDDVHYFLDMNQIYWATDWEEYSEFSGKTRREYDFLNDTAYKSLRLKVIINTKSERQKIRNQKISFHFI